VRTNWERLNDAVRDSLDAIPLSDMMTVNLPSAEVESNG
jgi:DNA-binding IscR family transcriptional regulator